MLPFSVEDFFAVFSDYNEHVWPAQWLLHAIAVAILLLPVSRVASRDRIAFGLLAFLWVWMAGAYHLAHFSEVNPAACLFAAAFLVQSALLAWRTISTPSPQLRYQRDAQSILAVGMIVYALLVYPLLNTLLGHSYPATPTFGVPCPTTILTLGVLMLSHGRVGALLVVPLLWSAIGGSATFLLGVWPDLGMLVSGLIVILWFSRRTWGKRRAADM